MSRSQRDISPEPVPGADPLVACRRAGRAILSRARSQARRPDDVAKIPPGSGHSPRGIGLTWRYARRGAEPTAPGMRRRRSRRAGGPMKVLIPYDGAELSEQAAV